MVTERPELDYRLIRMLQAQLGQARQAAVSRRRQEGKPALDGEDARQHGRALVQQVVTDYESQQAEDGRPALPWESRQDLVEALEARLFGAGSLQQLLEDESVENIDINGYQNVFVEYADGSTAKVRPVCASNEDLIETVQTLAAHEGLSARAFDVANVRVNLRLADGSRLYALQSVSRHPVISIRKHRFRTMTLKDTTVLGTVSEDLAAFLAALVRARKNLMVAGAVSAGKTSLLRALAREIDPGERLITVERSLELGLDEDVEAHPNAVALEERLANSEGAGAEPMAILVRDGLRMNPSRVIVGEVLGDEVVTMLNAMTQGSNGSLSTIHANSSLDVVDRIATYAAQAPERLPWQATVRLVASGLDFIIFMRRVRTQEGQQRLVTSVREVAGVNEDGHLLTNEVWRLDPQAGAAHRVPGVQIACEDELIDAGWDPDGGFDERRWA